MAAAVLIRMRAQLQAPTDYRWTMSDGTSIAPVDMKTDHLFNTVVMLWHHTMPAEAELYPHRRWRLGPRFTPEYTDTAIRTLLHELMARDGLTPHQIGTLRRMFDLLHRNPKLGSRLLINNC